MYEKLQFSNLTIASAEESSSIINIYIVISMTFAQRKLILANRVILLHSYWCIKGLSRQVQDMSL
jgi:hypothetical protein